MYVYEKSLYIRIYEVNIRILATVARHPLMTGRAPGPCLKSPPPHNRQLSVFILLPACQSQLVFISGNALITWFLSSQFTHKTANLVFTITNKTIS